MRGVKHRQQHSQILKGIEQRLNIQEAHEEMSRANRAFDSQKENAYSEEEARRFEALYWQRTHPTSRWP